MTAFLWLVIVYYTLSTGLRVYWAVCKCPILFTPKVFLFDAAGSLIAIVWASYFLWSRAA